jgi:3-hydroxypropionyl-coenzyme A dehydratase
MRLVGHAKAKELVFTGKMISADEAFHLGLVNSVISLTSDDNLPPEAPKGNVEKEKERNSQIAKLLNNKLMNECASVAKQIAKNSFNAVNVSKTLINRGMDADLNTGLRLEIYGWSLCFAHEDRQKMMSEFLNKSKK